MTMEGNFCSIDPISDIFYPIGSLFLTQLDLIDPSFYGCQIPLSVFPKVSTVDDWQVGHVNQVGHEIGPVDTSESKQHNYDQT